MPLSREQIKEMLSRIKTSKTSTGVVGDTNPNAVNALSKSVPITWFEQFAQMVEEDISNRG